MGSEITKAKRAVHDFVSDHSRRNEGSISLDELSRNMEQFKEEELRLTVMMEAVGVMGDEWPIAIALARAELGRREFAQTEKLTVRSTRWAACAGVVGALLGAIVGAWLSS